MPTYKPRISVVIPAHLQGRMAEKLAGSGVSQSEYIRRLITEDLEGHHDYMMRLIGHRLMQASVHIAAMTKAAVSDAEYKDLRVFAADMAVTAFGPLPDRPYDFEKDPAATGKARALHDLLDT